MSDPGDPLWAPSLFSVEVQGAGVPVVFIPGLATSGDVWRETVQRLGASFEAHVISVHWFEPCVLEPPILSRLRDELARYLRSLRGPVVVGHSLGAVLGYWLACTEPLRGLMAVDAPPYGAALTAPDVLPEESERSARLRCGELQRRGRLAVLSWLSSRFSGMATDPAHASSLAEGAARSSFSSVLEALSELHGLDLRERCAAIRVPVLVAIAKKNGAPEDWPVFEERWRRQLGGIPQLQIEIFSEARHFLMLDEPEAFFGSLSGFLQRLQEISEERG